jgi:hypothetical protein
MSLNISAVLAKKFHENALIIVDNGVLISWEVPTHPEWPTQAEIDAWTIEINTMIDAEQADRVSASQYAKLIALKSMTPAQVQTWVQNNVNTLADAKEAIKTLAVAVGILARNL